METQTLYKNEILWAVNKPSHTHFNEVLSHGVNGEWIPAHRLDFETSGILLHCHKSQFERISQIFKDPSFGLQKYYLAGVSNQPNSQIPGLIKGFIGSRYRGSKSVKFSFDNKEFRGWHSVRPAQLTLDHSDKIIQLTNEIGFTGFGLEVRLITGVRHQIRATLKALGSPIVNDPLYGDVENSSLTTQPSTKGPMELHAHKLVLPANMELLKLNKPLEIISPVALRNKS